MTPVTIIAAVLIAAGLIFMILSLIGIAKLPDFFTRLHAQGVGDTIGAFLILAGMMAAVHGGLLSVKILLIFIVIVLTNPLGTNLMMIAAINKEDYLGYRTRMTGEDSSEPEPVPVQKTQKEPEMPEPDQKTEKKHAVPKQDKKASKETDKKRSSQKRRKPKPSMKMNKAELIKAAESRGIKVPDKATKREILDLIYNKQDGKTD